MVSTRPKNATQHPGEIVKQATRKRRTAKEIAADNQRTREAQEAQQLAAQNGINRVAEVEASMEIEQAGAIAKAIPIKPRPRPVKQRPRVTEDAPSKNRSMLGQTSLQSKGDHTLKSSADDMGTDGDCELEVESEATEPPSTPLKTLKALLEVTCSDNDDDDEEESDSEERAAIVRRNGKRKGCNEDVELHAAPITGHGRNKTATGSVKSTTTTPSLRESDADDDTVSSLPLSGTPFADLPYDKQLEIVSFALEQKPHTGKRKIEEVAGELGLQLEDDSIDYEDGDDVMEFGDDIMEFGEDAMDLDSEIEDASPIAKKILKGTNSVGCTTTARQTSVTAIEKPLVLQPSKKARSEPSQTSTDSNEATVPAVPESMLADMAIKPAAGSGQWQNTDLPPILTENGSWRRHFIPTVLLWAADLLCAMQAIFNAMYPGVKYNIQPRGPIMGSVLIIHSKITQRLCTWHSNFSSTAIALIANFLASLRESEEDEDEDDEDKKENTDGREKFMTEMVASLLEGYAFLFAGPRYVQGLRDLPLLSSFTGFIDVPELDTQALSSTRMECVIGACTVALEQCFEISRTKGEEEH
ncbi:hypothetical protein F4604DRAFT_1690389 [Suillus subluteus]|nr:hypothetical protein F4604DRAFT_1690389 [Suillus subluteus]